MNVYFGVAHYLQEKQNRLKEQLNNGGGVNKTMKYCFFLAFLHEIFNVRSKQIIVCKKKKTYFAGCLSKVIIVCHSY